MKDLVLLKTAIFMYKVFNKSLPRNLLERFDIKHENTFYNLRSEHYFKLRFARTTQKQMCLSFCGIKLWNSISKEISKCQTLQLFKSKYKNDLISRYWENTLQDIIELEAFILREYVLNTLYKKVKSQIIGHYYWHPTQNRFAIL